MENNTGIYMIKNLINGKVYVGSAVNFITRFISHRSELNRNVHHSIKLQRAWNKYAADSFGFYAIQYCEKQDLIINEQYWIDFFDSFNNGYNCRPKAENWLGKNHTKESKEKNRLAHLGKKQSKETIEKRANSNRGQKRNEETKKKMGLSKIGNTYFLGKKLTEEHRQKLIKSNTGKIMSDETKLKISASKKGTTPWNKGLKINKI